MEKWPKSNTVRTIVNIFEHRGKNRDAKRLNKPLSKSLTTLPNLEKKQESNLLDNQDGIYNIERNLVSYILKIKQYECYSKETHIIYQQELVKILIDLVNMEMSSNDAIISARKELIKSIEIQFEELNNKLPMISKVNIGLTNTSIRKPLLVSNHSPNESKARSFDMQENDSIFGSVVKLRAIFDSSSDERGLSGNGQVNSNYSQKSPTFEDLPEAVSDKFVICRGRNDENASATEFSELKEELSSCLPQMSSKAEPDHSKALEAGKTKTYSNRDIHEISEYDCITENYLKNVEVDTQLRSDAMRHHQAAVVNGKTDTEELLLDSRSLNELSRNREGMLNVSILKRLFERRSPESVSKDQSFTEPETHESNNLNNTFSHDSGENGELDELGKVAIRTIGENSKTHIPGDNSGTVTPSLSQHPGLFLLV